MLIKLPCVKMGIKPLFQMQIKLLVRNKIFIFWSLVFPIILLLIFKASLGDVVIEGQTLETQKPLPIAIYVLDKGTNVKYPNGTEKDVNYGLLFLNLIERYTYSGSKTLAFNVYTANSYADIEKVINNGKVYLAIIVPENFSNQIWLSIQWNTYDVLLKTLAYTSLRYNISDQTLPDPPMEPPSNVSLEIKGIPTSFQYGIAIGLFWSFYVEFYARNVNEGVITLLIQELELRNLNFVLRDDFFKNTILFKPSVEVTASATQWLGEQKVITMFDLLVPSAIIYSVAQISIPIVVFIASHFEGIKYLRLKLAKIKSYSIILSSFFSSMVLGIIYVIIVLIFGIFLGLSWRLPFEALIAFFILITITLAFGTFFALFWVAVLPKSEQGTKITEIIVTPITVMLYFPLPSLGAFTLMGETYEIYDLLPWFAGMRAARKVILFGQGLGGVMPSIILIAIYTVLFLALSIIGLKYIKPRYEVRI